MEDLHAQTPHTSLTTPKPFMEVVTKPLHGNPMHTSINIPINTHTSKQKTITTTNEKAHNLGGWSYNNNINNGFHNVTSIGIKWSYSFAHQNIPKTT